MSDFAEKADRLLNQEHIKVAYAARAMDRIEAAAKRSSDSYAPVCKNKFKWLIMKNGLMLMPSDCEVSWSAIRDDEQDPLLAAEQAAMEELKDG